MSGKKAAFASPASPASSCRCLGDAWHVGDAEAAFWSGTEKSFSQRYLQRLASMMMLDDEADDGAADDNDDEEDDDDAAQPDE